MHRQQHTSTQASPDQTYYVKLTFKANRRETFINKTTFPLMPGDYAIVETENGLDMGMISTKSCDVKACDNDACGLKHKPKVHENKVYEYATVIRKGTASDIQQLYENRKLEESVFEGALKLIKQNRLNMKLVDVEYQFDQRKVTFFYVADERVDFRQLVKDLAYTFKTRIEMRQIGVRDQAKRIGGIGPCGQEYCCSRFLDEFTPVSTQYAKDQNLAINPTKLSGACGKLKCCLKYEWDFYAEAQKDFPPTGIPVEFKEGIGTIYANDFLSNKVHITMESGTHEIYPLSEIKVILKRMSNKKSKSKKG